MIKFFPPNTWQMMIFLNPLDALIPNAEFLVRVRVWVFWETFLPGRFWPRRSDINSVQTASAHDSELCQPMTGVGEWL